MKKYIKQLAIAIDQLGNTLCGGYADETISSRCHRLSKYAKWYNKAPARIIDTLFFWDKKTVTYTDAYPYDDRSNTCHYKHCELSYMYEQNRMHSPPEMRKVKAKKSEMNQ